MGYSYIWKSYITSIAVGEELLTTTRGSSYSLNGGLNWVEIEAADPFGYIAYDGHVALLDEDDGFTSGWASSQQWAVF